MHADRLYHRMLDYEKACQDARAKNLPEPPPFSVFNPSKPVPAPPIKLEPYEEERIGADKWAKMSPQEKELSLQIIRTERQVVGQYKDEVYEFFQKEYENRKWRQQKIIGIFGETVGKFLLSDTPPPKPRTDVPPGIGPDVD